MIYYRFSACTVEIKLRTLLTLSDVKLWYCPILSAHKRFQCWCKDVWLSLCLHGSRAAIYVQVFCHVLGVLRRNLFLPSTCLLTLLVVVWPVLLVLWCHCWNALAQDGDRSLMQTWWKEQHMSVSTQLVLWKYWLIKMSFMCSLNKLAVLFKICLHT